MVCWHCCEHIGFQTVPLFVSSIGLHPVVIQNMTALLSTQTPRPCFLKPCIHMCTCASHHNRYIEEGLSSHLQMGLQATLAAVQRHMLKGSGILQRSTLSPVHGSNGCFGTVHLPLSHCWTDARQLVLPHQL